MNGWNDYFQQTLEADDFAKYMAHSTTNSMPEGAIREPSETVVFGEKAFRCPLSRSLPRWTSSPETWATMWRRSNTVGMERGRIQGHGSNHTFADGSVRYVRFGRALTPINLWAVTERWRTNTATFHPN